MPALQAVRTIDLEGLASTDEAEPFVQLLLDRTTGAKECAVSIIRTPPGMGSVFGLHVHDFEQVFYILEGTMTVEIEGNSELAGPGSLVVFPAGVPHRNSNDGQVPTLHLSIGAPAPAPGKTGTRSVTADS